MLFMVSYKYQPGTGDQHPNRAMVTRFTTWRPPSGYEIKSHWSSAAADGGFILVEAGEASAIYAAAASFNDLMVFQITPVVPVADALAIFQTASAWKDSIS